MKAEGRTGTVEKVWHRVKKLVERFNVREDVSLGCWLL